jgi:hypothetical protein
VLEQQLRDTSPCRRGVDASVHPPPMRKKASLLRPTCDPAAR